MTGLVPVHGGLDAPVDRVVRLNHRAAFLQEAAALPSVAVNAADLSTVHRIADGTLSPLTGPMRGAEYARVLATRSIERGGEYAWTIPLAVPVTDDEARALKAGASCALRSSDDGNIAGAVDELEVFDWDKPAYVQAVYGTDRTDHPGARIATDDPRTKLLGGELRALEPASHPEYGRFVLSPRMCRASIAERGWERALAFQTRNPLHRAHEYALVAGVERLTAQGWFAGVVLNPLVGELKGDDVPAAVRMRCYQTLLDEKLLGQGDKDEAMWAKVGYDLTEVFALVGIDIKMFYGGPSEAIMHAIYRQNLGFSDIVVGRKHADAPFDDGTPIWGDFDAQEIFAIVPGLAIEPVKIGFAAFYESVGRVALMDEHPGEKPVSISGSKIRELLGAGEHPDERILRPEIADILIEHYRSAGSS